MSTPHQDDIIKQKTRSIKRAIFYYFKKHHRLALALIFSQVISKGLAINIEEYVPAVIPIKSTNTKSRKDSPPNRYKASSVIKTVADVLIDRIIV